jgi:manganese/iron transport system permease protein
MIAEFIESWPLFRHAYLAGMLLAALLATLGVQLIARDQIFFGAAVAQASTLGVVLALATAAWHPFGLHLHDADWYPRVWAIACSTSAAVAMEMIAGRRESREAVTGFIFLFASAAAMALVARSPFGLEEVHRLLASTIIVARAEDTHVFALLLVFTLLFVGWRRDCLLLIAIDPATAAAAGLRTRAWSIGVACGLAAVVGLSISVAGLLYVFGCLLMPVLAAKSLAREMRTLFWCAPLIGAACAGVGFVLAHAWDLPPAHITVVVMGLLLVTSWLRNFAQRGGSQPSRTSSASR